MAHLSVNPARGKAAQPRVPMAVGEGRSRSRIPQHLTESAGDAVRVLSGPMGSLQGP